MANIYEASGFRAVKAAGAREAAEVFAKRHLRRWHGWRNVRIGASRIACQSQDGSVSEVDVFAGYAGSEAGQVVGRNLRFVVRARL